MAITSLQIFALGLGLAATGPCLVSCMPLIIAYTTGNRGSFSRKLAGIIFFLVGRLGAYMLLGGLAGLSAASLQRFISPEIAAWFRPAAGLISIAIGISILIPRKIETSCARESTQPFALGGLLFIGFTIGLSPCGPLAALLSEIVLISHSIADGIWYGAMFGLGTFVSAFVLTAGIAGFLHFLPNKYPVSPKLSAIIRIICGLILIALGGLYLLR